MICVALILFVAVLPCFLLVLFMFFGFWFDVGLVRGLVLCSCGFCVCCLFSEVCSGLFYLLLWFCWFVVD